MVTGTEKVVASVKQCSALSVTNHVTNRALVSSAEAYTRYQTLTVGICTTSLQLIPQTGLLTRPDIELCLVSVYGQGIV